MNKALTIGDVCSRFSSGKSITADRIHEFGPYPVYGGNGLRGYTDEYNFDGDCAIIGRQGAYCGNVKYFSGKGYMTEHAIVAVANSKHNTRFLSYKLELMNLGRYAGQSAQPGLSVETLLKVLIDMPEKNEQDKIAKILSEVDSKISLNNSICADLEAMTKLLYDYWFVQFEFPDENGKPYKSSGGKMVWNNELKREIPYGWTVGNLVENDVSTVIKPGVQYFTKKNYLATANVVNDVIFEGDWISFENRESRANMEPKLLSVWFAKMKNSIKHISIPSTGTWFLEKYILSTGFVGIACTETSFPYIHSIINSKSFEIIKDKLSHGATQEAVNNDDLKFVRFVVPTEKILQDYSYKTTPLLEKKFDIIRENQELASLRDFLLPLMVNGQVAFKAEG